jgi:putative sterol carrier protein
MSDQVKYLSGEWCALAREALREQITPDKMKNISTSMSNIYKNCPDGKERFLFVSLENGLIADFQVGEGDPPKAEFRITGDYEVFSKITRAELGAHTALMTGKLKLKGNMVKALKLASLADRINKVFSTLPAIY